jgi:hypothetical protein
MPRALAGAIHIAGRSVGNQNPSSVTGEITDSFSVPLERSHDPPRKTIWCMDRDL